MAKVTLPVIVGQWSTAQNAIDDFKNTDYNGTYSTLRDSDVPDEENVEILFAAYWSEGYDGTAFVLYRHRKTGEFYTVQGGHCSCYGLEGQWSPVRVTIASLRHELAEGTLGRDRYSDDGNWADALSSVLDIVERWGAP